jgi:hypothetical protein
VIRSGERFAVEIPAGIRSHQSVSVSFDNRSIYVEAGDTWTDDSPESRLWTAAIPAALR